MVGGVGGGHQVSGWWGGRGTSGEWLVGWEGDIR